MGSFCHFEGDKVTVFCHAIPRVGFCRLWFTENTIHWEQCDAKRTVVHHVECGLKFLSRHFFLILWVPKSKSGRAHLTQKKIFSIPFRICKKILFVSRRETSSGFINHCAIKIDFIQASASTTGSTSLAEGKGNKIGHNFCQYASVTPLAHLVIFWTIQ